MSEKIGIDLKNLIKLISKVKKKRRKNKKSKKRKLDQINNNKPNFGHRNQIGGGGGGGETSYNPYNQPRSTPSVTTVVNTPSSGGQNDKNINPLSTEGLAKETKLLEIENKLNNKIKEINNDKGMLINTLNNISQNNVETTNSLYFNRMGLYLLNQQLNSLNQNPLTQLQTGTFTREQGTDTNDGFGIFQSNTQIKPFPFCNQQATEI